ncbi:MAG: aminotransferase class I/II-fold pyridoxal phosphate-dependent enzyme [Candidatus Eremiobacteraeota bacterium]|nr:aminotransferase class I/II-fold pyridoxal phosphate-dependent enzyme [Candidatus Eremiobacteraeota bacterium]
MKRALQPLGFTQGVAPAALLGPEEIARRLGARGLIRLGSNESPFGPGPKALAAIQREAALSHRYGDPACFALREAVAGHHGVPIDCVAVGAGIDDLLGWVVRAFLSQGMSAIASRGAFPTFEMHVNGFGASLTAVPYRSDGRTDLDGFVHVAKRCGGGLIFLPNPDNPSGSSWDWGDVEAFLDALPDDVFLIHDEAYANFLSAEHRFPLDTLDERMVRMRTFSKEYGLAGLRVGYALGTPKVIGALDAIRLLYGVNRLAQAAALASLSDSVFMEDVVARIAMARDEYHALARRLGLATFPSETNFVLFDFGDAERARSALESLLRRGIHVRKPAAPPLDGCIRVSVGTPAERERFAEELEAIVADDKMAEGAARRTALP